MERNERKAKARARALRAARVVTIAAALVAPGCFGSHGTEGEVVPDATVDSRVPDGRVPDTSTPDARIDARLDANLPDARVDATPDATQCPPPMWTDCCEEMPMECCTPEIGFWDEFSNCCTTCVIGPLVPPSMTA